LVEDFFVVAVDFFAVLVVAAPFLAVACVLEVVVMVSLFLLAQEDRNATPIKATVRERMDFFISW
jgi:hypothetical protein